MVPATTWARIASRPSLVAYTSVIPVYRLDVSLEYTLDEKKASRSQQEASPREAVDEALNQDQTERDLFLSAVGRTVESAFDDMRLIKKMWHKEKGVQGFHLVQSFAPGEASPELAHQIGQEFAQKVARRKISGGNQHPPEYQMPAQPPGLELGIPYEWQEIPEQSKNIHYPNTPDFR